MRMVGLAIALCWWTTPAHATEKLTVKSTKPLWEFGAGLFNVNYEDYIGSSQRRSLFIPRPFFIYRGEKFYIDRGRVGSQIDTNSSIDIDLSIGGYVPVNSASNVSRRGMPNLGLVLSPGISLIYNVARNEHKSIYFSMPVQYAVELKSGDLNTLDFIANPRFTYIRRRAHHSGIYLTWSLSGGVYWQGEKYNQFYYGVEPRYALPNRPAYQAQGGYSGSHFNFNFNYYTANKWLFTLGGRYINMEKSVFDDSPLLDQSYSLISYFSVVYIFAESIRKGYELPNQD